MKLTFLGTGAAYYPVLGSTSAYFKIEDTLYLLDCGETTFTRLIAKRVLMACTNVFVIMTHIHADHFGSLGSLISYCKNILDIDVTILYPDPIIKQVLRLTGLTEFDYSFSDDFTVVYPGGIRITPEKVKHDLSMTCVGYYIDDANEVIYYGGDSCGIPDELVKQLDNQIVTYAYLETTYESKETSGHTSLQQLCRLIPKELRKKVVCMHFGDDFRSTVKACGFEVALSE